MKGFFVVAGTVLVVFLTIAMFGTSGWTSPPIVHQQNGPAGSGMHQIHTVKQAAELKAENQAPTPPEPASADGDKAGTTYQNVKVLKDLSTEQFNRLMTSMTEWVAPEQGCTFCHNPENMADDSLYQKKVTRRMLEMVQYINTDWKEKHVGEAGVTCYTCHRGNPVPKNIWFENTGQTFKHGVVTGKPGVYVASFDAGATSVPYQRLADFLAKKDIDDKAIEVEPNQALPDGKGKSIMDAEATFGLMMHISKSLGVNCTYCHNTQQLSSWPKSTPARKTAQNGIRMVRDLNTDYLEPLKAELPPNRLGPDGDVPKIGCATCHNGQSKPLGGAHVVEAYPELARKSAAASDAKPAGGDMQPAGGDQKPAGEQPK